MDKKCTKWQLYTNLFHSKPPPTINSPNLDFWFENKPSGNPGPMHGTKDIHSRPGIARWYICILKMPICVNFERSWAGKVWYFTAILVYVMAIWYFLLPFF
jgi:hypothetical protein